MSTLHQKLGVPELKIPQLEIWRRLMATRNEWKLYPRKCDATGDFILSAYAPDSPFTVYKNAYWWSDKWDALAFARAYSFDQPFFSQFADLQKVVPREGTSIFNSENCEYNGHIRESKNCYLNSLVAHCEDMLYSYWMVDDKDTMDSAYTNQSTLCYECMDSNNCYNCVAAEECENCSDTHFSYQMRNCQYCLFCSNLINKTYHIQNKPCTKEEFASALAKIFTKNLDHFEAAHATFATTRCNAIHRGLQMINCENSIGDHLYGCKNSQNSFESKTSEDCNNSISAADSRDLDSIYSAGWPGCELIYCSCVTRGSQNIAFSTYIWFSSNLRYCDSCVSCQDCFGCIGLRHKKFCILNKQYTEEEYKALLPRIIEHMTETGEWGQFFPPMLSPFAYNETGAQDFFPLTEEEAIKAGFKWRKEDPKEYQPVEGALSCQKCKKNYRIVPQESKFYEKMGLPTPKVCPSCRHAERFARRNKYTIFSRPCSLCGKDMQSTFDSSRLEKVYCEECYLKEVY